MTTKSRFSKIIRPQPTILVTMGIRCGHAATYSLNGLSLNQIYVIAKQRSIKYHYDSIAPPSPTIDIDASWLVRSKTSISPSNKIGYLMRIAVCFVTAGFNVVIVCDSDSRHHSKRATTIRIADSFRNKILFLKNQNRILHLFTAARLAGRSNTDEEKLELKHLSKETKSLEKKLSNVIYDTGNEFFIDIFNKAYSINQTLVQSVGSGSIHVIQAEQQADSCIAARANRHISHMILTADSDQAVLLGSKCVSIKAYHFNNNDGTLKKLDLFSSSYKTIKEIADFVSLPLSNDNYTPAKYVLFDTIDDYRTRALIAVGIGCDVYHSGVKNVGPKTLHDFIIKLKNDEMNIASYYFHIMKMYSNMYFKRKKNTLSDMIQDEMQIEQELAFEKMINIFVESFLYEPCNYYSSLEKVQQIHSTYIHDPPSSLHLYNKAFRRIDLFDCCPIVGGADDVDCCVGPGNGEHFFLIAEGRHFCLSCARGLCNSCLFNKPLSEQIYCNECFLSETNVNKKHLEDLPTEEQMRKVCIDHGCQANMTDEISDLINLYQNIILNTKILDKEKYGSMVAMPSEPTSYLDQLDVVVEFTLQNGGCFVNNEDLPFDDLVDVLEIMKELVEVDEGEENSIELTSNAVTPKLVQFFAEQSRIHFGWRLLERGMRHSIDLLTTDVSQTYVKIFKYNGDTGLYLQMKVRSSMRKEWYDTEVAFTMNTIVACKCSCKCGSNDLQRVVCIHVLPTMELIGFFLKEALAEHILIETSYYVKKTNLTEVHEELLTKFRSILEVFLITCRPDNVQEALNASSFREMLCGYDVGTDKRKFCLPPPRDPKDLGPIKDLNFQSIRTITKNIRTGSVSKIRKQTFNIKVREEMTHEQYLTTAEACSTFCALYPKSSNIFLNSNMVGYKVLEKRTETKIDFNNIVVYTSCSKMMGIAIEKASSQFRFQKKRNNNELKDNENTYTCIDEENDSNDDDSVLENYGDYIDSDGEDVEEDCNKENIPPNVIPPHVVHQGDELETIETRNNNNSISKIKRKSCCANGCAVTTTNKEQAIWYYVPHAPRCQPIKSHSDDKQRKLFATSKFHREQYLIRLGLDKKDARKSLVHCDEHELVFESIDYKYKNKNNEWIELTKSMKLPKDPNKAYKNTRNSVTKYNPATPKKKVIRTKYKINNNEHENCIINKMHRRNICHFQGCNNKHTSNDALFKLKRIPRASNFDPLIQKKRNNEQLYYTVNNEYRKLVRKRCGIHECDTRRDLRICNRHKIVMELVDVSWQPINTNIIEIVQVKMYLPTKISKTDSQPSSDEKNERFIRNSQREIRSSLDDCVLRTSMDAYANSSSRSSQNTLEILLDAIESIKETISSQQTFIPEYDNTPLHFDYELKEKYKRDKVRQETKYKMNVCTDKFIKLHTGFKSLSCMMSFILVVCKGETEIMIKTTTSLTFFEEWLLYLTIIWGRSCTRWFMVGERFDIGETTCRRIFDVKQQMVLDIREDWPKYTNFDEDISLQRKGKWSDFFDNTRVVMWDMTDISIHQPSCAEPSRLTFSSYYGGTCAKGGIFLQSSSWLGTHDLWMGAVSDSEYLTRCGILEEQMMFVCNDLVFKDIVFTNITDKGFRVTADCFRVGGQKILQPPFMRSDKRFTTEQVLEAAAIATIRSANERAVNRIKECEYIKKGLREAENVERICSVYLTFGFQANFMFLPVQ